MSEYKIIVVIIGMLFLNACRKEETPTLLTQEEINQIAANLPNEFMAWANIFEGDGVGSAINLGGREGNVTILFNKSGTRYAWFENDLILGTRDIKAADSHFRDVPFDAIGAATKLGYKKGAYFFNLKGTEYTVGKLMQENALGGYYNLDLFDFNKNIYTPYDWGIDGSCPHESIRSLLTHKQMYTGSDIDIETLMTDISGRGIAYYFVQNNQMTTEAISLSEYMLIDGVNWIYLPMEEVGGMTFALDYLVFFAPDGRSMGISKRGSSKFDGMFSLY